MDRVDGWKGPMPWKDNPDNPKYYKQMVPTTRKPSWGDFFYWVNEYYSHGEHAVIYTDQRTPKNLIKVINTDITDSESNWEMADFMEDNWQRNVEGLPRIYSFTRCEVQSGIKNPLQDRVATTNAPYVEVMRVLDMDKGDELAMWVMEKADYVGLTHPDLTKKQMIERVASAAQNITERTGEMISDLRPPNYGFRQDGTAFIFDFNIEPVTPIEITLNEISLFEYYAKRIEINEKV